MSRVARIFSGLFFVTFALSLRADPGPLVLWYTNAAVSWTQEALPVGNGKLSAMIFGGVNSEQIQFNEETIWTGQPHFYENPNATPANLASIRAKVFNGQSISTTEKNKFMSVPLRQAMFQPAGSLLLNFAHSGATQYRRSLDLDTATACVSYGHSGTTYNRDVFASAPDKVIVIRLTASAAAKLSFTCAFSNPQPEHSIMAAGNDLVMNARVSLMPRPEYFASGLTNAIRYEARVRVIAEGGSVTPAGSSLAVTNADAVILLLSIASNFVKYDDLSADYSLLCSNNIAAAAEKTYGELRQRQLDDYQPLFRRVSLDLGTSAKTNLPINHRIRRIPQGDDPNLSTLYFQLGRYLMISGSRPGTQPLTLQGKWNETTNPSWESKMTLNINQELNYAGAEVCNLPESHIPMFSMAQDLAVTGSRVAQKLYEAPGWVVHHNTDLWRGAAPINNFDGMWPAGQAWLCQNLWWHYEFNGDTNYLANTAYPLMKSAAEFFLDFLIPHPANTNWLVTNPSYSSEHNHPDHDVPNVPGPTMDNELIRELCDNIATATEILGIDAELRTNVLQMRDRLPPQMIGRLGQLQEWLEDVDEPGDTHRHMSHLVGLWPGETITPFHNARVAAAAKVSTDIRGNGDIGWGKAWRMNLRARLLDAERAYYYATNVIADPKCSTNLVFHDNPNRQVDAIFGMMNGVAELFLQSQRGEVFILPALPSKWTNGAVTGLRARGGFEVDIEWQSNRLASATILSTLGNTCRVRSKWPIGVKSGSDFVNTPMVRPGLWEFPTVAGQSYTIVPANAFEAESGAATPSPGSVLQSTANLAFSRGQAARFNAAGVGASVSWAITNLTAGRYRLLVVANARPDGAQFQPAFGSGAGELRAAGAQHDTYSATNVVYLLATNSPPANFLSTNMLKQFDCGIVEVASNSQHELRFTITGKNVASIGHVLELDYIVFQPEAQIAAEALRAEAIDGNLILSWPAASAGFSLEQSDDLPGANWVPHPVSPIIHDDQKFITNALEGSQMFYRLRKP
ncbi:MAG TPA: glycoside hydrolase family 95 protein [Verrucomicrobiae bacterium]|nr:glycoside hydrolase family 95 protein [Verrucomicrobiae bacterium]